MMMKMKCKQNGIADAADAASLMKTFPSFFPLSLTLTADNDEDSASRSALASNSIIAKIAFCSYRKFNSRRRRRRRTLGRMQEQRANQFRVQKERE